MNKTLVSALLLGLVAAAPAAHACGEVMYRMGSALRYHAYITRHPAEILVYAAPAHADGTDSYDVALSRSLEKAGHKVTRIADPDALQQALASHAYNIVIAYAGDLPRIEAQIGQLSHGPSLIPVFRRGDEVPRSPLAVKDDADVNQFLKTIERTMRANGA